MSPIPTDLRHEDVIALACRQLRRRDRPINRHRMREGPLPMTSELSVTYSLRRHPSEISRARELARKALTDWGLANHTDLAELIVSELAKKIVSSETIRVSVGHGLDSMNSIQTVNSTMWM
jgi:hypothetical protein